MQSLAMVAEVVHGAPCRFQDPARFSLAHGGKDRHAYPVPIQVYDETIRMLKAAVQNAKLGRQEQMQALKRLDDQARQLKRTANRTVIRGVRRALRCCCRWLPCSAATSTSPWRACPNSKWCPTRRSASSVCAMPCRWWSTGRPRS